MRPGGVIPIARCGRVGAPGALHRAGFSLLELLISLGIVAVLLGLLLPLINRARVAERSVACLSNLKTLALGLRMYATQHGGRLPDPGDSAIPWEQMIRPQLGTSRFFECPADVEMFPNLGSSYDWRDTGNPLTTMAGRPLAEARSDLVLVFDSLPSWHQPKRINVALIDASAKTMDQGECFADLDSPVGLR
jgi:prepilin-type N-terminal cleavage/methylation domain-containing protein